jgi:hypothetical protein
MPDVQLNLDEVRRVIFSPKNRRRTVWTASSLPARLYNRHANILKGEAHELIKPIRLGAAQCLRTLWRQGAIYRQESLQDVGGWDEVKYVRPGDASGVYFVACERCGQSRRSVNRPQGRVLEACLDCGSAERQVTGPGAGG